MYYILVSIKITLETGLPVVRNKTSGHGQGSAVTPIPDEFAEYELNLAATNIAMLVGIYRGEKTRKIIKCKNIMHYYEENKNDENTYSLANRGYY